MAGQLRAVIDVGTNSVKVLVGRVEGRAVTPLHEESFQTRLGQGFYQTKFLRPEAIELTARSVAEFSIKAKALGATSLRVIATSAAREASNQSELLAALEAASGVPVELISGAQEADWAFEGVATNPAFAHRALLVLDIGGGSSEFILGREGHRQFGHSFPLGTVRLLEKLNLGDSPGAGDLVCCEEMVRRFLEDQVATEISASLRQMEGSPQLIGTGGTTTILARVELQTNDFDRESIEKVQLSTARVAAIKEQLWRLPLDERKHIIGVPPNRADVILPGVVIIEQTMRVFGVEPLRVSTRGLRFAALMD